MNTFEDGAAIVASDLRKTYGEVEVVRGIDLRVQRGEVFALLGPNGAGKTTVIEILEGHRRRASGEVRVLGRDPEHLDRETRTRIGIVLQTAGLEPYLTVAETVDLHRGYYPSPRPRDEVLELVGLHEETGKDVARLSSGQRRRLDLALALAGDPELLFLDEATTGFDPAARRDAWEIIRTLAGLGKTVFLTTNSMDEAQVLADHLAVLNHGEIVAEGVPPKPEDRDAGPTRIRFRVQDTSGMPVLGFDPTSDGMLEISTDEPAWVLHELTAWALANRRQLDGLEVRRPTLEDMYLELIRGEEEA